MLVLTYFWCSRFVLLLKNIFGVLVAECFGISEFFWTMTDLKSLCFGCIVEVDYEMMLRNPVPLLPEER